jgi:hypothetical protein
MRNIRVQREYPPAIFFHAVLFLCPASLPAKSAETAKTGGCHHPRWTVGTNDHLRAFILHTKFSCDKVISSRFVQLCVQGHTAKSW